MSPPSNDVPHSPDRRSSSAAIFGAFRNLAGNRPKGSPAPSLATSITSAHEPGFPSHQEANIRSASLPGQAQDGPTLAEPPVQTGAIIGGPPELAYYVGKLGDTNPLPERIGAVHKICPLLKEYSICNVLSLWSTASDLLSQEDAPEARNAGYTLLKTLVSLPDLTPIERHTFFRAVTRARTYEDFDFRLEVLWELTKGGRNVESFESHMASLLASFLDTCFKAVQDARRKGKKARLTSLREEDDLNRLFQYILDIVRFNSKIFRDVDLQHLLKQIIGICKGATRESDIINCINLCDAVITYAHIPSESLRPALEVLCDVHRQLESLQERTWRVLSHLFRSHMGHSSVMVLLNILIDYPSAAELGRNTIRGIVYAIQRLVLADGSEGLPKVPISLLFPALRSAASVPHPKLQADILQLVSSVLGNTSLVTQVLDEEDWNDLVEVVILCSPDERGRRISKTSAYGNSSDEPKESGFDAEAEQCRARDSFDNIIMSLHGLLDKLDIIQKASVMDLFLRLGSQISDSAAESLIRHYTQERLLYPSNEHWLQACEDLLATFFKDSARLRPLRLLVMEAVKDAYATVECVYPQETVLRCANLILENIVGEKDVAVLEELLDFAINLADWASDEVFDNIIGLLRTAMEVQRGAPPPPPSSLDYWESASVRAKEGTEWRSACNVITRALVRMFMRNLNRSSRKSKTLFDLILEVAKSEDCESDARISALKLLFRLRSDAKCRLYVNSSSEGENIAAVLCRTVKTAISQEKGEESPAVDLHKNEEASLREKRSTSAGGSPHTSLTRHATLSSNPRFSKPTRPLWMYPGPRGLPEEPSDSASHVAYSSFEGVNASATNDSMETVGKTVLPMNIWLELVISLLQKGSDWELYSYALVHFGSQLANKTLFRNASAQVKMLRNVLCEQIRISSFHEPPAYTSLKKADVAVCIFHILTMLISYHEHFEKSEEDDLVRAFLLGIGSWDRTSKWCIHAVTVCCHELPLSTSKVLENILQKMSQIITQPQIAIHILEFLASLARLPTLYKNFRDDQFKLVFGVCFRYLQYARDQHDKGPTSEAPRPTHGSLKRSGPSREFTSIFEHTVRPKEKSAGDDLPQYVYALAYHVITFWFMALKLEDRQTHMQWITKNLIHTDRSGREIIEEQAEVTIDMMKRVAWSDRDETAYDPKFASRADGEVLKKTWIVGQSILTIETAAKSGLTQMTTRRASGTRYAVFRPQLIDPPRHQVPISTGLAADAYYTDSYIGILPEDVFQTLYSPLSFPGPSGLLRDEPFVLPEDDLTRRAISAFDRNPTVDGHRIGVIYIGDGQTSEEQILCNVMGTSDYTNFITGLGTLTRLKGAKINAGGLDREFDSDGEYTICWRDRVTEIVFHITTLMPTNPDDPRMSCIAKKRLIGNDHVNIIFNDSGLPYKFDTFPSDFNYVFIVISPESRSSFVETRLDVDPEGTNRFYKVQVMSKPGFPEISPAAEAKVISGRHLAPYIRSIALNASVFSLVWQARKVGESISAWRNRLREIKRLRERYHDAAVSNPSSPVLHHSGGHLPDRTNNTFPGSLSSVTQAFSPPARESGGALFKRTSVATFISEGTSRSSIGGAGGSEMERQASDGSRG